MNLTTAHSLWLAPLCVLLGLLYAWWLYRRGTERHGWSRGLNLLLGAARTLAVALIAFFLLEPMVRMLVREERRPVVVVAHDASRSLLLAGDTNDLRTAYAQRLQDMVQALEEEHVVRVLSYAGEVTEGHDLAQTGQRTDIAKLFHEVADRFGGGDLAAVIIDGDGIQNRGRDPRLEADRLGVPVFTIALGDTTIHPDLVLKGVEHNRITYLGNEFPVLARVQASHLKGRSTRVIVRHEGREVATRTLSITADPFFVEVPLLVKADRPGTQRYTVEVPAVEGEEGVENNRQEIFIDVLDDRRRILIVAAAPHPDIAALRGAMDMLEGYTTEVAFNDDRITGIEDKDLIVLHGLPAPGQALTDVLRRAEARKIPLLVVVTQGTDMAAVTRMDVGVSITAPRRAYTDAQAHANKDFALFTLEPSTVQAFERFPPMQVPFAEYALQRSAVALFQQRVGVVRTGAPLIAFRGQGERRSAVICGEGIWRWRMADQQLFGTREHFDGLVHKMVQLLALHADKSRFRVNSARLFAENEPIIISAELYNATYEAVNEPEAEVVLRDEQGAEYPYVFSRRGRGYHLEIASLPAGRYTYTASAVQDGSPLKASGELNVQRLVLEQLSTVADHGLWADIAARTGGRMVYGNDLGPIVKDIAERPEIVTRSYAQATFSDLVDVRWLFYVLLALLTLEWVLRRRNGAY